MSERLTVLPHDFDFIEDNRAGLTFSGSIRLDPTLNAVVLKADANGDFPLTGDQYVVSALYKPKAVRQWLGFQVDINHVMDGDTQLTGDGYRLSDGTSHYYWNGSAWAVTTTQWSTEAQIAANIQTFPATARQLAVVVKLSTTSAIETPTLSTVHIAWTGKVEMFEDIVYRSLVPLLKTVRTITDFAIKVPVPGGFQLDIMTPVRAAGYPFNVVDVEGVFNNNLDPDNYSNLLQSYNTTTGIATLTTAIPVGSFALCRLVLQPQVAIVSTAQDYTEVEAVPAVQIADIAAVDSQPLSAQVAVTNKATGASIVFQPPYRFNLRFTMIALTPGGVDLMRILRALVELVENNPTITSKAVDEQYRFWMTEEFSNTTTVQDNNLQSMQAVFEIRDILTFEKPTKNTIGVQRVNVNVISITR